MNTLEQYKAAIFGCKNSKERTVSFHGVFCVKITFRMENIIYKTIGEKVNGY